MLSLPNKFFKVAPCKYSGSCFTFDNTLIIVLSALTCMSFATCSALNPKLSNAFFCVFVALVPAANPKEKFFNPVAATSEFTPLAIKVAPIAITLSLEIPAIPPSPATLCDISTNSGAVTATLFAK